MKAGWRSPPLADVCIKVTDGSHFSPTTVEQGYPYITVRDLENGVIDLTSCKKISTPDFRDLEKNGCAPQKGDILFSKDGTVGKVALVDFQSDFVVLSSLAIVRPKPNLLDSSYLAYAMQNPAFLNEAIGRKTGVAIRRVVLKNLKSIEIPLPPIDEQQRIVAVLDKVFAGIAIATANAQKNLTNARALFESLLDQSFEANDTEWRCELLNKICNIGDGNHSSKYPKSAEMVSAGVPFLRSTNIQDGKMSLHDVLYISPEKHRELKKGHLKTGDVLFTNRGEIGKVAMIEENLDGANLNSQVAWLRSKGDVVSEYLYFYLQSGKMKMHYQQTQSGTALQQFTIKMLQNVNVRFPSAIDQQRRLVEKLKDFRRETENFEKNFNLRLAALSELKQSLLQKAFAGELT